MSEYDTRELLATRKQNVTVTFNLKDQHEREIYEWYSKQTDTSSTFFIQVLSQYKEYREFVQTVSKLHEMLPLLGQILPMNVNNNAGINPLQQMSSQVNQLTQQTHQVESVAKVQPNTQSQPFSTQTAVAQKTALSTGPEPMPSRSVRHGGGSKRRRTSMPME